MCRRLGLKYMGLSLVGGEVDNAAYNTSKVFKAF